MARLMDTKNYWNANLDTDNLSRDGGSQHADIAQAVELARTPEFEWLLSVAQPLAGKTLIDIGGGIGMHAIIWARAGAHVVVADLAAERLKALCVLAEKDGVAERMQFVACRAEELPFAVESADFVFTKSVLIHTDLPVAAKEMARVLRPDGRGLFIEPMNRNPIIALYRHWFAPKEWRDITRYFDQWSLDALRGGFGFLRWKPYYLLSAGSFFWQYMLCRPKHFAQSLAFWRRIDRKLTRRFHALEKWCWFAAIETRKKP